MNYDLLLLLKKYFEIYPTDVTLLSRSVIPPSTVMSNAPQLMHPFYAAGLSGSLPFSAVTGNATVTVLYLSLACRQLL